MKPFSHPDYEANAARCGDGTPCVYCGRPVKNPHAPEARVLDGGARFATKDEAHGEHEDSSDMGWIPAGIECARVLRAAGVYLCAAVDRPTGQP